MTTDLVRTTLSACAARAAAIFPAARHRLAPTRKLAAYLAVVELELPAPKVRRALAWRRGELDAACLDIEELRENPDLDEAIASAGRALRASLLPVAPPIVRRTVSVEMVNAQRTARAARRALELLVAAGGEVVGHEAFGTAGSARTAICAARKKIGPGAIRTIRGRGFQITEAGLQALRINLGRFGEAAESPEPRWLPSPPSERAAA
jgi:hypothetical protein